MQDLVFLESVKKMPLMDLPVRSTFVKLDSAGVLISPGSCLELNQLTSLKGVTDLVAPNLFHTAGIAKASSVFSESKKWCSNGGRDSKKDIAWTDELDPATWPYQKELTAIFLKGAPKINEVVFYHKKSKSLIVTDLCFNMVGANGVGAWLILNSFGTYRRLATSKFFVRFISDRNLFEESLTELFSYDFENIIVSHGDNVIGSAKEKLRLALKERGLNLKS